MTAPGLADQTARQRLLADLGTTFFVEGDAAWERKRATPSYRLHASLTVEASE